MPSGENRTPEARREFESELTRMIQSLRNHPSIVMWVPFNEGWGQYDPPRIVELVRGPNSNSGRLLRNRRTAPNRSRPSAILRTPK